MQHPETERTWGMVQWAIILCAAAYSCWGALHPFAGDTANSRLATVYALVHHGTWEVGNPEQENPFQGGTVDKVRVDGLMYSSKPPVLPLIMTAQYLVLHHVFGLDLNLASDRGAIARILTILCSTLPFLLSGIALFRLLKVWGISPWVQSVVLLTLMWGSEYAGYAATMNNHVPATACLIGAMWGYWALDDKKNVQTGILCGLVGVLLGLAVTIDLPSAIFVLLLGVGFVRKFNKINILWGIGGACIPLAIHAGIMVSLTGSPLPFQLNHDYYLFEESYWRNPVGVDALDHSWGLYLFNMTFGRVGLFIMYPLMGVGLIGLLREARLKESAYRWWSLGGVVAFGVLVIYYVTGTNNYGGVSFGFRWLIIATPFLLMGAAFLLQQVKSRFAIGVICLLVCLGIFSAYQCHHAPWSVHQEWPVRLYGPLY